MSNTITEPYQFVGFINQSKNPELTQVKKYLCKKFNGDFICVHGTRVDDNTKVLSIEIVKNLPKVEDPYKDQRDKLLNIWIDTPENKDKNYQKWKNFCDKHPEPRQFSTIKAESTTLTSYKPFSWAIYIGDGWTESQCISFLKEILE